MSFFRRGPAIVVALATLAFMSAAQAAGPNAIDYTPGCLGSTLAANDDGSTGVIGLPFEIDFFGTHYNSVYVNNNGNVTFTGPMSTYTPFPITTTGEVIIAPFFGDVDTRGAGSGLVHWGDTTFNGRAAFCVLWTDVGNGVGYYSGRVDKKNSFQLLLVERSDVDPGDFDIVFNYDQIQWETGNASGGSGGLGGNSARAGYSNGDPSTPATSFELPGSAINGAFLDSSATGLIHDSRNTLQLGRYIFAVRNGAAPSGGTITGNVTDSGGNPVLGALVQVCPKAGGACAWQGTTNAVGDYTATGLPDDSYDVKAYPPAGSVQIPAQIDPVIAGGNTVTGVDLQFTGPVPPPPGTGIEPSHGGGGGVPVVYWGDPTTLTTSGCANGTATYEINGDTSPPPFASGPMTESPAGSGDYGATVPPLFPNHGNAVVAIHIDCPSGPDEDVAFPIYIDPSGFVRTIAGAPIAGATVTLYRSDSGLAGTFAVVPDGSAIMSPSNRTNPDLTDAGGHFGWDVVSGYYRVRAEATDCHAPGDPGQAFVESAVLLIPPAVIDLDLRLECIGDTTPPVITTEGDRHVEATGAMTPVSWTASAVDDVDGPVDVVCTPASGSGFAVGTTPVHCEADDAAGNHADSFFDVFVEDTTGPSLPQPPDLVVNATGPAGAVVTFVVNGSDLVDGTVAADCTPGSGSTFGIGHNEVSCTATDAAGNASVERTFDVFVKGALAQIEDLADYIDELDLKKSTEKKLLNELRQTKKDLVKGKKLRKACDDLEDLVKRAHKEARKHLDPAEAAYIVAAANRIMAVLGC